jgi:GDP-D-mannose dehydratase
MKRALITGITSQGGPYLGEDDIVRFADQHGSVEAGVEVGQ